MEKVINAQITKASLGYCESAVVTFEIQLKGADDKSYRFGGYCLDTYNQDLGKRIGTANGMEFLLQTLKVVGVSRWEELPGKYVRIIVANKNRQYISISTIGNLMRDNWLNAEKFWAERSENETR